MATTRESGLDGSVWLAFDDAVRRFFAVADRAAAPVDALTYKESHTRGDMTKERRSPGTAGTRWSLVLRAGGPRTPVSRTALEELCRGYLAPLRALAGHFERDPIRAEDLVQS